MDNKILMWRAAAGGQDHLEQIQVPPETETLNQATRQLPTGGYTTFRTFGRRKVLRLHDHYDRLVETAALAGKDVRLNWQRLHALLSTALHQSPYEQARVRIVVDLEETPGTIYILVEALHIPSDEDYTNGVSAITRTMHRDNPKAKLTGFIETSARLQRMADPNVNEILMVGEDGQVLEGLSSNFFGVRDGRVYTAEEGVLPGITRSLVLEAAGKEGIPVVLESVSAADLKHLDEAFITSASRAVLPVVEIDDKPVGGGKPGPVTKKLLQAYLAQVAQELVEV